MAPQDKPQGNRPSDVLAKLRQHKDRRQKRMKAEDKKKFDALEQELENLVNEEKAGGALRQGFTNKVDAAQEQLDAMDVDDEEEPPQGDSSEALEPVQSSLEQPAVKMEATDTNLLSSLPIHDSIPLGENDEYPPSRAAVTPGIKDGKVIKKRSVGRSTQYLVQHGPKRAPMFSLQNESEIGQHNGMEDITRADVRQANRKDGSGKILINKALYRGIRCVLWDYKCNDIDQLMDSVEEELNPVRIAERKAHRKANEKAVKYPTTLCLVEWEGMEDTWEPRSDLKALKGKGMDKLIYDIALDQVKRHRSWLDDHPEVKRAISEYPMAQRGYSEEGSASPEPSTSPEPSPMPASAPTTSKPAPAPQPATTPASKQMAWKNLVSEFREDWALANDKDLDKLTKEDQEAITYALRSFKKRCIDEGTIPRNT